MSADVFSFPASIYPDVQQLTPEEQSQEIIESKFSSAQTVITFAGSGRWRMRLEFNDMVDERRADVTALATKLRTSRNVLLIHNFTAQQRGVLSGTPRVNSFNAGATTIWMGNIGGTVNSYFRAGDFISVNCELKMVTSDTGPISGNAFRVDVWPPVRFTASSGTVCVVSSPCGGFRLSRSPVMITLPPGYQTSISMDMIEAVNSSAVSEL